MDIKNLKRFSESEDRDRSPIFVGRADMMARLTERANLVREDWLEGLPLGGKMRIITACPGMGKTSLLQELAARASRDMLVAAPAADELTSAAALKSAILSAARKTTSPAVKTGLAAMEAAADWFDVGAAAVRAGGFAGEKIATARPVVVTVDEAQGLDRDHKAALRWLFLGDHGLPLLPVLAGLDGTPNVLRDMGVSPRLADGAHIRLGPLEPEDSRRAFDEMRERFDIGMDPRTAGRWAERIANDCGNFPQHLHIGLQTGAAEILRAHDRGREPSLDRAAADAAKRRDAYYRARLGPELANHGPALLAAVRRILASGGRAHIDDVETAFRRASDAARKQKGRPPLPRGGAATLVRLATDSGVFQRADEYDGRLELPIPSMGDFIERRYGDRAAR